jgi:hypothetical protein
VFGSSPASNFSNSKCEAVPNALASTVEAKSEDLRQNHIQKAELAIWSAAVSKKLAFGLFTELCHRQVSRIVFPGMISLVFLGQRLEYSPPPSTATPASSPGLPPPLLLRRDYSAASQTSRAELAAASRRGSSGLPI